MSAKKKIVLKGFDYMHCDDFAKYLSDMASKGWHFVEWGAGLKFEKGEPQKAVYAVEVFQKASENDMRPEPNTEEFAEYCESAGWKFIDAKQKFCIFKKIDDEAMDLFTPEERVANAFKGSVSGTAWALLFVMGLNAFLQWERLCNAFESVIFSNGFLVSIFIWNAIFLRQLMSMVHAFWKKQNLKKEIRLGNKIYIGSKSDGKFHLGWNEIYIAILVLLLVLLFLAMDRIEIVVMNVIIVSGTFLFFYLMNKKRPDRDTSVLWQIVFMGLIMFTILASIVLEISADEMAGDSYKDNLPVVINDYRDFQDEIDDVNIYHERSVFGTVDRYYVYGKDESIHYHIYRSLHSKILDKVWMEIVTGKKYNEELVDCTADWDARLAVRNLIGTYYVRYDDVILEFSDGVDVYLSEEQIDIILDKLELR